MKRLSIWNGHNGLHLSASTESSPETLLTNLLDWSHILLFLRLLTRSICGHAQSTFTTTTGFRITMVSLSQLQLSWFGIVDKLVGLITHFIVLQIIPKVSKHFMFNLMPPLMNSLSIWYGRNGLHLRTSTESIPERLLTNLFDWSHILFIFRVFGKIYLCSCPVALNRDEWIQDGNGLSISASTQSLEL
jgi:hypothetical protein